MEIKKTSIITLVILSIIVLNIFIIIDFNVIRIKIYYNNIKKDDDIDSPIF